MSARKQVTKTEPPPESTAAAPIASRPRFPREYGVPTHSKGLLPWSHVTERLTSAEHYWICTVNAGAQPHATPVDGIWLDDSLYFGGSSEARWWRNLLANPSILSQDASGGIQHLGEDLPTEVGG